MSKYSVIVGNIGIVLNSNDYDESVECFNEYVESSENGYGRESGEDVFMVDNEDGSDVFSHTGYNNASEEEEVDYSME